MILLVIVGALLLTVALPAFAGGHAKATGSVEWTSGGTTPTAGIYTEFALHDRSGDDVRGSYVYMTIPRTWGLEWREITVICVTVDGDHAHWGGYIDASNNAAMEGMYIQGWVYDGGTPGSHRTGDGTEGWSAEIGDGVALC